MISEEPQEGLPSAEVRCHLVPAWQAYVMAIQQEEAEVDDASGPAVASAAQAARNRARREWASSLHQMLEAVSALLAERFNDGSQEFNTAHTFLRQAALGAAPSGVSVEMRSHLVPAWQAYVSALQAEQGKDDSAGLAVASRQWATSLHHMLEGVGVFMIANFDDGSQGFNTAYAFLCQMIEERRRLAA